MSNLNNLIYIAICQRHENTTKNVVIIIYIHIIKMSSSMTQL